MGPLTLLAREDYYANLVDTNAIHICFQALQDHAADNDIVIDALSILGFLRHCNAFSEYVRPHLNVEAFIEHAKEMQQGLVEDVNDKAGLVITSISLATH
jgi:hypothetical protein